MDGLERDKYGASETLYELGSRIWPAQGWWLVVAIVKTVMRPKLVQKPALRRLWTYLSTGWSRTNCWMTAILSRKILSRMPPLDSLPP